MMEPKTKEPKFQIGDIVSHHFKNGNIETKEICKILFINHDHNSTIDIIYYGILGYTPNNGAGIKLVREDELTLVRKWDGSIPSDHAKQSEEKSQVTYSFLRITDKSFETLVLAVKLIEGLTPDDIVEVDRINHIIEVTRNLIDKLCEFVNTKNRLFDPEYDCYIEFNGCDFCKNNERLRLQHFLDDVVEPIIVEELKRRTLANTSN